MISTMRPPASRMSRPSAPPQSGADVDDAGGHLRPAGAGGGGRGVALWPARLAAFRPFALRGGPTRSGADLPSNRQDRRSLANGGEYFGISGSITNVGKQRRNVPQLIVVLRDAGGRKVYSWEITPAKRVLAPGEALAVSEAMTDIPRSARSADIGWKAE
jgi:hypothetical protein